MVELVELRNEVPDPILQTIVFGTGATNRIAGSIGPSLAVDPEASLVHLSPSSKSTKI